MATDRIALGLADAARATGVSTRTLWAEIAGGRLRVVRPTGRRRVLVLVEDLKRWLDGLPPLPGVGADDEGARP
ncbi:MAG: hypothetical protein IPM18_12075 [Phycisphaerales bacterium]|nr:hypothetical protein [Phycisphaerales bacterium]